MVTITTSTTLCKDSIYIPKYNVHITGYVDGNVDIMFPDGILKIDGSTNLDFYYDNLTNTPKFLFLIDPSISNNKEIHAFTQSLNNKFEVITTNGYYKLKIKAEFIEPTTGIHIPYEYIFTNME